MLVFRMRWPSVAPSFILVQGLVCVAFASGCSATGGPGAERDGNSAPQVTAGSGSAPQPSLNTGGTSQPDLGAVPDAPVEKCDAVLQLTLRDFQPTHPD